LLDVSLLSTVEHRRRDRHAMAQIAAQLDQLVLAQRLDGLLVAVDLFQHVLERTQVALAAVGVDRLADLEPKTGASPAEVRLEDLPDIHAARHAERIEHDVDRRAVGEERHVLGRHDLRHHALVAMAAGHLVAGLDLALHRDEDLDHLHHAGRQLVAALQLLDLVEEPLLETLLRLLVLFADGFDLGHQLVVRGGEHPPLRARVIFESFLKPFGPAMPCRPSSNSARRPNTLRSRIACSSSRSLARRSISSRSIASARSSFSTPWRLNTRTSTTVPCTPGGTRSD